MDSSENFFKERPIKQIVMSFVFIVILIGGWYCPFLGYFIPVCMLLGIGIGFFRGRKWCDWYCPRGSFYDTWLKAVSLKKEIPVLIKKTYFRLIAMSVLMMIMALQLARVWPNINNLGKVFVILVTTTTSLGIILALFFHQRSWCYLCPVGLLANFAGRGKEELKIDSKLCVECKMCSKVCPLQLAPFSVIKNGGSADNCGGKHKKFDTINPIVDADCLKCGSCINACPKKALFFNPPSRRKPRV